MVLRESGSFGVAIILQDEYKNDSFLHRLSKAGGLYVRAREKTALRGNVLILEQYLIMLGRDTLARPCAPQTTTGERIQAWIISGCTGRRQGDQHSATWSANVIEERNRLATRALVDEYQPGSAL